MNGRGFHQGSPRPLTLGLLQDVYGMDFTPAAFIRFPFMSGGDEPNDLSRPGFGDKETRPWLRAGECGVPYLLAALVRKSGQRFVCNDAVIRCPPGINMNAGDTSGISGRGFANGVHSKPANVKRSAG